MQPCELGDDLSAVSWNTIFIFKNDSLWMFSTRFLKKEEQSLQGKEPMVSTGSEQSGKIQSFGKPASTILNLKRLSASRLF